MLAERCDWPAEHQRVLLEAALRHLVLSRAALARGRRGAAARHRPDAGAGRAGASPLANVLRTIPSLALLVVMLPLLGTGFLPAVVALTLYGLPAILLNTYTGLREVDPDIVEAARGQGLSDRQIMRRIEIPLALPVIFAGIRTAAVQIVSAATLAAFIGGGGLGELITAGMGTFDFPSSSSARSPSPRSRSRRSSSSRGLERRHRRCGGRHDPPGGGHARRFPGAARPAVDRLDLDVPTGTTCVLIGPSGCGKTTTMRMVNRLIEPTTGRILVEGEDVSGRPGPTAPRASAT